MLWVRKLQLQEVESIHDLLAVITDEESAQGHDGTKPTQNGGMKCIMTDGTIVRARDLLMYWTLERGLHLHS